jgi:hypothetical protein
MSSYTPTKEVQATGESPRPQCNKNNTKVSSLFSCFWGTTLACLDPDLIRI